MNERIATLRKCLSLSQTEFGKRIGVSRDTINNIENNRNKNGVSNVLLHHICEVYHVNPEWLKTGNGEIFVASSKSALEDLKREYDLSNEAIKIINNFIHMTPERQVSLIESFEKLLNE